MILSSCVAPATSQSDYAEKVASTARDARSAVETARLVVRALEDPGSTARYTARALSDAEATAARVATHLGSVQPPTADAARVGSDLLALLDEVETALAALRVSARQGRLESLPRLARGLPSLSKRLEPFERPDLS